MYLTIATEMSSGKRFEHMHAHLPEPYEVRTRVYTEMKELCDGFGSLE